MSSVFVTSSNPEPKSVNSFDLVGLHTLVFVFIDGFLYGFISQLHVLAKNFCNHVKCTKYFLFRKVYS